MRGRGSLAREYVITYRDHLEPNETLMQGHVLERAAAAAARSHRARSVDREEHPRALRGFDVGDVMRFDVLGRIVEARVTSVRDVEWEDARSGGFMFVFRPGPLERAPHTFIGFAAGAGGPGRRGRCSSAIWCAVPERLGDRRPRGPRPIQGVVDNVTFAISIVGGVALASGVLILIGAVAMTKFQRVYEAAILRTLGASTRMLGTMLALEYSALGLLAGLIGAVGALGLSWAVCRYVFEIAWRPAPSCCRRRR